MNAHQLQSARLERSSQNGEARLTLESASEWLKLTGLCFWSPGQSHAVSAPTFVEAVVGRPAPVPSAGEIARAGNLLRPMVESAAAVPLKFGVNTGEGPERIASPEALRYVYALRGDRNFKSGPSITGKASVTLLALHCFEAIRDHGPLTVSTLQTLLGQDITEAALRRALDELWLGLFAFPIWTGDPETTMWDSLSRRFPEPVAAGACTSHVEAQSALISLYLHSVVAVTEEEVLTFLGPLAPQSKLREVLRDLGSMRQLEMVDIGGRAHLCLPGEQVPEMAPRPFQESPVTAQLETQEDTAENGPAVTHTTVRPDRPVYGGPARTWQQKKPFQRRPAADGSRPSRFTPSRFARNDSRKPFRSSGSPKPDSPSRFRGHGDSPAGSGGKTWSKLGGKPWAKRETGGPRPPRRDWERGGRSQRSSGPHDRDPRSRDRRSLSPGNEGPGNGGERSRRDRGRVHRPGNVPGRFRHSSGQRDGSRPPRRWEQSTGRSDTPGTAEKRPWEKKPRWSKTDGPRSDRPKSRKFSAEGTGGGAETPGKQPFWAKKPRRAKGSPRKPGAKSRPHGKKK